MPDENDPSDRAMQARRTILLLPVLCAAISSQLKSEEVNDLQFGFRFSVPDGFVAMPLDGGDEDLIYLFVDPETTGMPTAIQIRRMRGTIDPDQRLTAEQLPATPGIDRELEVIQWNGLTCAVSRYSMPAGDSVVVCYGIQFPLPEEAVQLQVCGLEEQDAQLRLVFDQSVASFVSTRQIAPAGSAVPRRMSATERDSLLFSGILGLTLTILVLIFIVAAIGKMLARSRRRPDPDGTRVAASAQRSDDDGFRSTCPWCDAEIHSKADRCTACHRPV